MSTDEIKARLNEIRGVNEYFMLLSQDPLIRVGSGIWGLNHRDVAVKRDHQSALMDYIVDVLSKRGQGIHISEISSLRIAADPNETVPYMVLSLASQDRRLATDQAQYLFLQDWGESRRVSMTEAVVSVLSSASRGLTIKEVLRDGSPTDIAANRRQARISGSTKCRGCVRPRYRMVSAEASGRRPRRRADAWGLEPGR